MWGYVGTVRIAEKIVPFLGFGNSGFHYSEFGYSEFDYSKFDYGRILGFLKGINPDVIYTFHDIYSTGHLCGDT